MLIGTYTAAAAAAANSVGGDCCVHPHLMRIVWLLLVMVVGVVVVGVGVKLTLGPGVGRNVVGPIYHHPIQVWAAARPRRRRRPSSHVHAVLQRLLL